MTNHETEIERRARKLCTIAGLDPDDKRGAWDGRVAWELWRDDAAWEVEIETLRARVREAKTPDSGA